jgi:hypothetical protein
MLNIGDYMVKYNLREYKELEFTFLEKLLYQISEWYDRNYIFVIFICLNSSGVIISLFLEFYKNEIYSFLFIPCLMLSLILIIFLFVDNYIENNKRS